MSPSGAPEYLSPGSLEELERFHAQIALAEREGAVPPSVEVAADLQARPFQIEQEHLEPSFPSVISRRTHPPSPFLSS